MGKGTPQTTNSTSSVSIPPWLSSAYLQLAGQAQQVASQPFQPYPADQFVAPFTPTQNTALSNAQSMAAGNVPGMGQDFTNAAYTNYGTAAQLPQVGAQVAMNALPYFQGAGDMIGQAPGYIAGAGGMIQQGQDYLGQGAGYLSQGAGYLGTAMAGVGAANAQAAQATNPLSLMPYNVEPYLSPYIQHVVDTTQNQFNNQNSIQGNSLIGQAIAAGNAFGGDRAGVAQAQLAGQQQTAQAPVIAGLYNQGYVNAQNEFNTQQAIDLQSQQLHNQNLLAAAGIGMQGAGIGVQGAGVMGQYGGIMGQLGAAQGQLGSQYGALGSQLANIGSAYGNIGAGVASTGGMLGQLGGQLGSIASGQGNLGLGLGNLAGNANNSLFSIGSAQQGTNQALQTDAYNQFLAQQGYPFQTTGWLANLLTGLGARTGSTTTGSAATTPASNPLSTAAGLGLGLFSVLGANSGGRIPEKKDGGAVTESKQALMKAIAEARSHRQHLASGGAPSYVNAPGYVPQVQSQGGGGGLMTSNFQAPGLMNTQANSTAELNKIMKQLAPKVKDWFNSDSSSAASTGSSVADAGIDSAAAVDSTPAFTPGSDGNTDAGGFDSGGAADYSGGSDGGGDGSNESATPIKTGNIGYVALMNAMNQDRAANNLIAQMTRSYAEGGGIDAEESTDDSGGPDETVPLPRQRPEDATLPDAAAPTAGRYGALRPSAVPSGDAPEARGGLFNMTPTMRQALLATAAGMLSANTPHFGQALGAGVSQGLQQYKTAEALSLAAKREQRQIDHQNASLGETARHHRALEQRTPLQKQSQTVRTFVDPESGIARYGVPNPKGGFSMIDPKTGKIIEEDAPAETTPAEPEAPASTAPTAPIRQTEAAPTAPGTFEAPNKLGQQEANSFYDKVGMPGETDQLGGPKLADKPVPKGSIDEVGVYGINAQQAAKPYDYSNPPDDLLIEKGMDVPKPKPAFGKSSKALQDAAEYYYQTGKMPANFIVRGRGEASVIQARNISNVVQNYAGALAESRGLSGGDMATAWRAAPMTKSFILGDGGKSSVALGTAIRHLDTVSELGKVWQDAGAGDSQALNQMRAAISRQFGQTAATNLDAVGQVVGPEIIKALGVAGAGTEKDREHAGAMFSTAKTPKQLQEAVKTVQTLLAGQIEGKYGQARTAGLSEEQFKRLTGEREFNLLMGLNKKGSSETGGGKTEKTEAPKREPTQRDIDYVRSHPELRDRFIKTFGREP